MASQDDRLEIAGRQYQPKPLRYSDIAINVPSATVCYPCSCLMVTTSRPLTEHRHVRRLVMTDGTYNP